MSAETADCRGEKATKRRGRGHPPFIPTDEQRRFVTAMAGIRMTWEEIRQLIVNPTTGEPSTKTTLARAFKRELKDGRPKLKSLIATRFYEAQFGWKPDGAGGFIMPPDPQGERRHNADRVCHAERQASARGRRSAATARTAAAGYRRQGQCADVGADRAAAAQW
jgi:hypothetical protein